MKYPPVGQLQHRALRDGWSDLDPKALAALFAVAGKIPQLRGILAQAKEDRVVQELLEEDWDRGDQIAEHWSDRIVECFAHHGVDLLPAFRSSLDRRISSQEADRGIYFDFEGRINQPPVLAGFVCEGVFVQRVLSADLSEAASAEQLEVQSLGDLASDLTHRCEQEDRRIIAFSQHEKNIIRKYGGGEISPFYADGRKIARRWMSKCHPDVTRRGWGLKKYLRFIDFPFSTGWDLGRPADHIRIVTEALRRHRAWQGLTGRQKRRWALLLTYNRADVEGLEALVRRAAHELDD